MIGLNLLLALLGTPSEVSFDDLTRFPDKVTSKKNWDFAVVHTKWVESQAWYNVWNRDEWCEWCREAEECRDIWELLLDAETEVFSTNFRYERLWELRERLGQEDWISGTMPPFIPIWRFVRRD